jgi:hypothetical protein
MNGYNWKILLCGVGMTLLVACNEQEPIAPSNGSSVFWNQPHSTFMGMKGHVQEIQETHYFEEEGCWYEGDVSRLTFSPEGHITAYQPTVFTETGTWTASAQPSLPSKRSFSERLCDYTYHYEHQRLTGITINEWGADMPVVFHLTYGTSSRFIPLPCPLGTQAFFLIQGIATITADGIDFTMEQEGNTLVYTMKQQTWRGTLVEQTSYEYEAGTHYPTRSTTTTTLRDIEQTRTETLYTFAPGGALQTTQSTTFENSSATGSTTCRYRNGSLLLPSSRNIVPAEGATYTLLYEYDRYENLVSVTRSAEGETAQAETILYESYDAAGNWTTSFASQSSQVDPNHNDATIRTERSIRYY